MKKHLFRGKPLIRVAVLDGLEITAEEYVESVAPSACYKDGFKSFIAPAGLGLLGK